MAPHSSTLAWKIPWMKKPGRLQSMGSLRVGHDWTTSLWLFTFVHWRRKWQPTPVFLPGESQGREGWWAAIYGVAQSRTWLKWLSSSITIPGNCSFLEINCHRKLCFLFQWNFPNFISLHGGEEAYVASQQHSLQITENRRVIEAIGSVDTHHSKIFYVTSSATNATNLQYNMLFLSLINPLPLPSTL